MSRIDQALKQAGATVVAGANVVSRPVADLTSFPVTSEVESHVAERDMAGARLPLTRETERNSRRAVVSSMERLVISPAIENIAVEQYRRLAAVLHQAQSARGVKVVMVASAEPSEGKSLTAANLALTLSESYKRRVLLVDADLRSPSLDMMFQVPFGTGLSESLRAEDETPLNVVDLSSALALLPGGSADADPMAGLTSGRMQEIVQEAAGSFDWVIIDTPPVGLMTDAHLLSAMVDAAVLVIAAGSVPCATVQRAIDSIGRDKIIGVVLNRVAGETMAAKYYNYRASDGRRLNSNLPEVAG
jgi:capsular exopolysaccharide synthesis family protein